MLKGRRVKLIMIDFHLLPRLKLSNRETISRASLSFISCVSNLSNTQKSQSSTTPLNFSLIDYRTGPGRRYLASCGHCKRRSETMSSTLVLNNGLTIPILGLGTWKSKSGEAGRVVKEAIDFGYRHIDCSPVYQNEKEIGLGIKTKLDEGKIKREEIFITSKLWNSYHAKELVEPALKTSLKNLGLSYLDLYLIHWPMGFKEGSNHFPADKNKTIYSDTKNTETWKAMEECVKKGLTKSIGISNFNKKQTEKILKMAEIKPVTNQVECHPYLNQQKLMDFCAIHGIIITAYSPLGSPDRPNAKAQDPILLEDPIFKKIAQNYGKTPAQILIRYQSKPGEVTRAVKDAIDAGYRHIDCAHVYQNEKEVGAGIKAKIDEGKIKREDLFITSKLWNTFHKKELVEPALKASLKNLGLSYLDLYLIHWPMGYKEGGELFPAEKNKTLYSDSSYLETWKAMEECVKKGLVKSIGISNFNKRQTEDILRIAEIKPVTNQVECHPYLNQQELMNFSKQHGILITAYSPLGSPDRPMAKPEEPVILEDPLFKKIGDKHGKTPGQILIRYQIERGNIVIPKSVNKGRIQQNIDVFDFKISEEDMDLLNGLMKSNGRMIVLANIADHKDYPFIDPF